jgi:tetratricopeptide (TPR) repeat protein
MSENPRIADLRRRVQKDPASIAFAQLAEEYRRAGQYQDAVEVCRAGLAIHPGYLSARVTLGRALLELKDLGAARAEFEVVLKGAPENLAAVRGLAEVLHRSGALAEALAQYKAALGLARNDPDLEQTVEDLTRELAPKKGPLFDPDAPPKVVPPPVAPAPAAVPAADLVPPAIEPAIPTLPQATASMAPEAVKPPALLAPVPSQAPMVAMQPPASATPAEPDPAVATSPEPVRAAAAAAEVPAAAQAQVKQTIEALEQWLDAIHVSRSDRSS